MGSALLVEEFVRRWRARREPVGRHCSAAGSSCTQSQIEFMVERAVIRPSSKMDKVQRLRQTGYIQSLLLQARGNNQH